MITLADFDKKFMKYLGSTRRWGAFRTIVADLIARGRPVNIVETGCAREPDNWAGDGQSTLVWDWLLDNLGGTGLSMDINEDNCRAAASQVQHFKVACVDSVVGLRTMVKPETLDFLYLDSYDLTETIDSPTHHLAELASVYPLDSPTRRFVRHPPAGGVLPSAGLLTAEDWRTDGKARQVDAARGVAHRVTDPALRWRLEGDHHQGRL